MSDRETEGQFTHGDTKADLQPTIKDPDNSNNAINLTGFTVKLHTKNQRTSATPSAITAALTDAANGIVTFDCVTIAANEGRYLCQIELIDGSAKTQRTDDFAIGVKEKVET